MENKQTHPKPMSALWSGDIVSNPTQTKIVGEHGVGLRKEASISLSNYHVFSQREAFGKLLHT